MNAAMAAMKADATRIASGNHETVTADRLAAAMQTHMAADLEVQREGCRALRNLAAGDRAAVVEAGPDQIQGGDGGGARVRRVAPLAWRVRVPRQQRRGLLATLLPEFQALG